MSWKYHKSDVEGIRKMKWDALWHVMYKTRDGKETWDRVDKKTAMYVLKYVFKNSTLNDVMEG